MGSGRPTDGGVFTATRRRTVREPYQRRSLGRPRMGASCGVAAAPAPDIEAPSHPQPAASATAAPVHRERNLDLADETKKITASEQQVAPPATRDSAGTDVAAEKGWYMNVIVESHQGTEKKERRRSRVLTDPTIYRNIQVPFSPLPLLQKSRHGGVLSRQNPNPKSMHN